MARNATTGKDGTNLEWEEIIKNEEKSLFTGNGESYSSNEEGSLKNGRETDRSEDGTEAREAANLLPFLNDESGGGRATGERHDEAEE